MKTSCWQRLMGISTTLAVIALSGCSSKQPVNFKVHTEPEGAYVVYRQDDFSWVYLGVTPLDIIEIVPGEKFDDSHTFSLKAMRCGYHDQIKEWSGEELEQEVEQKGSIFWTPRLIKNVE